MVRTFGVSHTGSDPGRGRHRRSLPGISLSVPVPTLRVDRFAPKG